MVVVIIGILSLAGASSYHQFNARKRMDAAVMKITEYIHLAQQKTRAQDTPDEESCTYGGFYTAALTGSTGARTLTVAPDGCAALVTEDLNPFDFPQGDFSVSFESNGTSITTGSDTCIIVEHPSANVCSEITIQTSGIVSSNTLEGGTCSCP